MLSVVGLATLFMLVCIVIMWAVFWLRDYLDWGSSLLIVWFAIILLLYLGGSTS